MRTSKIKNGVFILIEFDLNKFEAKVGVSQGVDFIL